VTSAAHRSVTILGSWIPSRSFFTIGFGSCGTFFPLYFQTQFKPRRATGIPSLGEHFPRGLGLAEPRDANGAQRASDLSGLSWTDSHRTNSAEVRNWLRSGVPSEPHASRHAGLGNYRNNRCSRTPHTCEDAATNRLSSCNLHSHLLGLLNAD
jgi:hypothetical protein